MYSVFTDIDGINTTDIDDVNRAFEIAEGYNAQGYTMVEIRDNDTGYTVYLYDMRGGDNE